MPRISRKRELLGSIAGPFTKKKVKNIGLLAAQNIVSWTPHKGSYRVGAEAGTGLVPPARVKLLSNLFSSLPTRLNSEFQRHLQRPLCSGATHQRDLL